MWRGPATVQMFPKDASFNNTWEATPTTEWAWMPRDEDNPRTSLGGKIASFTPRNVLCLIAAKPSWCVKVWSQAKVWRFEVWRCDAKTIKQLIKKFLSFKKKRRQWLKYNNQERNEVEATLGYLGHKQYPIIKRCVMGQMGAF